MNVNTTRFGTLEVSEDAAVSFPDGLIGLPGTQYVLLAHAEDSPFLWLQSVEEAAVAVPVTTPWLFFESYEVRVGDDDARRLGLNDPSDADILCVVRAGESLQDFSANLAAPVILHRTTRVGRQIINDAGGYSVRHPLFDEVGLNEVQPATSVSTAVTAA
jgi:flagellar assembly factor FliW